MYSKPIIQNFINKTIKNTLSNLTKNLISSLLITQISSNQMITCLIFML